MSIARVDLLPVHPTGQSEAPHKRRLAAALWGVNTESARIYGGTPRTAKAKIPRSSEPLPVVTLNDRSQLLRVINCIAERERVDPEAILGRNKSAHVCNARLAVVHTALSLLDWDMRALARCMTRNRTTILRSAQIAEAKYMTSPHFAFLCQDAAAYVQSTVDDTQ